MSAAPDPLKLTTEEQMLLDRHLAFYESLACGDRTPNTNAQRHFVEVTCGHAPDAGICHAACDRMNLEMKPQKANRGVARGVPAPVVAHL